MGNQLVKGYSVDGEPVGSVGYCGIWKLYRGVKQSTKAAVSIFVLDKKHLNKGEREQLIKMAKKQASGLTRVRHPGVLAIVQPLTQNETILAYVTERVQGSLLQLISSHKLDQLIGSELQLKLCFYPLLETISFLHDNVKQAHLDINLTTVYLTPEGKCKLAGFTLNQVLNGDSIQQTEQKVHDYSSCSPQLALNKQFSKASDTFSFGLLIYRMLQVLVKEFIHYPLTSKVDYEKIVPQLKQIVNCAVVNKSINPGDLKVLLQKALQWDSTSRCTITEVLMSKWMNNQMVLTARYLDKISNYEPKQQLQFLKGLAGVLDDFDSKVTLKIIIPKLMDLLKFGHLIASIIYIAIDSCRKGKLTIQQFRTNIWPHLKQVTQGREMTAHSIYLLVKHMETLEKYIKEEDMQICIIPIYLKCFECPQKLKQLALANVQRMAKKMDYQFTKTKIFPKVIITLKDTSIEIRKDSLKALLAILNLIDSQTISSTVLPAIEACRKISSDNYINAITVHIYNMLSATLSPQIIGTKILPILIPYLIDTSITRSQLQMYKTTIMAMIGKIEKERRKIFESTSITVDPVISYTEADFKFNEEPEKKQNVPSNYSFLTGYADLNTVKAETGPVVAQNSVQGNSLGQSINSQPVEPAPTLKFNFVSEYTGMTNYNAPNSLTNNKPSPGSSYNAPFNVNSYHLGTIKPEYKPTSSLPIDANGFGMGQTTQPNNLFKINGDASSKMNYDFGLGNVSLESPRTNYLTTQPQPQRKIPGPDKLFVGPSPPRSQITNSINFGSHSGPQIDKLMDLQISNLTNLNIGPSNVPNSQLYTSLQLNQLSLNVPALSSDPFQQVDRQRQADMFFSSQLNYLSVKQQKSFDAVTSFDLI